MNSRLLDWVPDLLAFLRRSWRVLLTCSLAMIVVGIAYLLLAPATYTATSTLMIDVQATAPFQQQPSVVDSQYASGIAESQVEVLQSMGIAREVVRKLNLVDDAEFLANGQSLANTILGILQAPFETAMPSVSDRPEISAAELLTRMIRVRRIGMSFILEMDVKSNNPQLSARLNGAIVDAFVTAGLDAKNVNTKRASAWLQDRIALLQRQAVDADRAVQDFKAQAGIVDTDKGLMNEQHLSELNSQLVLARARLADASARRDRIRDVMTHGFADGQVSDALEDPVITHLREQYVDDARQKAEWESKVGPNHATVLQMDNTLKDIQQQIQAELNRIAQSTESDYQVALSNQRDIERQLAALIADADLTNVNLVRLRELQSAADNYKSLYADFLQRYTEAVQDQSFPISEVRVVTRAATPLRPSWPLPIFVLPGSLVLGLCFGFAVAMVRDSLDRGLHTASQVRAALGLPCLGMLPKVKVARAGRRGRATVARGAGVRQVVPPPPIMRQITMAPFSPYAEAIRGLRFRLARAAEGRRPVSVIGCVSAMPGEGKTTVSANFAFFLAEAGFHTLLIDWDLRKHTLSRLMSPKCDAGFAEVVNGSVALADAIWRDPATGLDFLPAGEDRAAAFSAQTQQSAAMAPRLAGLLTSLREQYDYVVVDLPAMLPVVDAAAAARLVDGVVIVVEWARTPVEAVRDSLEQAGIEPQRLLGVVLNKVDLAALRLYGAGSQSYSPVPLVPA